MKHFFFLLVTLLSQIIFVVFWQALEHYTDLYDIKRAVVHTHLLNPEVRSDIHVFKHLVCCLKGSSICVHTYWHCARRLRSSGIKSFIVYFVFIDKLFTVVNNYCDTIVLTWNKLSNIVQLYIVLPLYSFHPVNINIFVVLPVASQLLWLLVSRGLLGVSQSHAASKHQTKPSNLCPGSHQVSWTASDFSTHWYLWILQELWRSLLLPGIYCQLQPGSGCPLQIHPGMMLSVLIEDSLSNLAYLCHLKDVITSCGFIIVLICFFSWNYSWQIH